MNYGIFVGRFCPLHLGHEVVIQKMLADCDSQSLLVIGSSNAGCSLRHFFSYEERRAFIHLLFPELKIVGLPDYTTDAEWLLALDDILLAMGINPTEAVFYGGCTEDIDFFLSAGRQSAILNRFDGSTPKTSATEVRDALIHDRSLDELLNPIIQQSVRELFSTKWEKFKRI